MAKILAVPDGSTYQAQLNLTLGTWTYNTSNRTYTMTDITTSAVRNKIGAGTNDVGLLCTSPLVNKWALFRPSGVAPFNIGDFLGYNHHAGAPTYFFDKSTTVIKDLDVDSRMWLAVLLRRGERPPQMDDPTLTFDRLRVELKSVSGDISIDQYIIAPSADPNIQEEIPNHIFWVQCPSNDYYNVTVSVKAYYANTNGVAVKEIEDVRPNLNITIRPYVISMELLVSNMFYFQELRHRYIKNDKTMTTIVVADYTKVCVDDLINPLVGLAVKSYVDSIPLTITVDGIVYEYGNTEGRYPPNVLGGTWRTIGRLVAVLTTGYIYKNHLSVWYQINSIPTGYYAIDLR